MSEMIPQINYSHIRSDGFNVFRQKFGHLADDEWRGILLQSIANEEIDGVHFPRFPEEEFQNSVHGNSGATSIAEAVSFYRYVRDVTYKNGLNCSSTRVLDFGCGWGRMIRPFMRDFELCDMYGFDPNFLSCAIARTLNPYVTFLSGSYTPTGTLPYQFFTLVFGWSVFSHLSEVSAALWLRDMSRVVVPGGWCVFTTWGRRFLNRLQSESNLRADGKAIHWYSDVCIKAAGSIANRIEDYERGDYVWFTSGGSTLYGEAFVSKIALQKLIRQHDLPFQISNFDTNTLPQDVFVLHRL